jgi:hypothetical protein
MHNRLREQISFSARQKGFVPEAGCFNNVQILNEVIHTAKVRTGMIGIQLNVGKAFDTIFHQAITPALERIGVPREISTAIKNAYESLYTTIDCGGCTVNRQLRRGVKRDPCLHISLSYGSLTGAAGTQEGFYKLKKTIRYLALPLLMT